MQPCALRMQGLHHRTNLIHPLQVKRPCVVIIIEMLNGYGTPPCCHRDGAALRVEAQWDGELRHRDVLEPAARKQAASKQHSTRAQEFERQELK